MPKVTEEYSEARRQQIIDAAYRCFARKGFHQTSMRDIYAEAGLSPGAIYHYFASKDDIIEASFIFDYQRSQALFQEAAEAENPLEAIDRLIEVFYSGLESAAQTGADRINIQGWGEALVTPRLLEPLREFLIEFRKLLAVLIRRGQEMGKINRQVIPEAAGEVILSSFLGLYLQKAVLPDLDVKEYTKSVRQMLYQSFAGVSDEGQKNRQGE